MTKMAYLRQKKPYFSWLVSYFVFLFLLVAAVGIITAVAKSVLREEIMKANLSTFATIESNVGTVKSDLNKLAANLTKDEDLIALAQMGKELDKADYWDIFTSRRLIDRYLLSFDYIDEICIYSSVDDRMLVGVSDLGLVDPASAYGSYIVRRGEGQIMDYGAWKDFMRRSHMQELYETVDGGMVYLQSIPFQGEENIGTLIMTINPGKLSRIVSDGELGDDRVFLVMNEDGDVIFRSRENVVERVIHNGDINLKPGSNRIEVNGEPMMFHLGEHSLKLRCAFAISEDVFWRQLNLFYAVTLAIAGALVLAGIGLAFIFSKRHFTPLADIMKLISKAQPAGDDHYGEFESIEKSLETVLAHARQSERISRKYQNASFQSAFAQYLKEPDGGSAVELFAEYGVAFAFQSYVAALVSVNDISDYFGTVEFDNDQEKELIKAAITNVLEEMLGSEFFGQAVYLDNNMLFCLYGTNRQDTALITWLKTVFPKAEQFVKENVGIYYSVSVSAVFQTLDGVVEAYSQALDVYTYSKNTDEDVLFYDEIDWKENEYEFTLDFERKLLEAAGKGDFVRVRVLLEQLLKTQSAQSNISQRLVFLRHDMISLFAKLFRLRGFFNQEELLSLERSKTMEELRENVLCLLDELRKNNSADEKTEEAPLGERIRAFVDQNYADVNLNVNLLGERFGLSPSYLSKTFKLQTGIVLREYIIGRRLSAAELLLATDKKLDEVAVESGFIDAGSFIRTFKKYRGETPGKFRDHLR